MSDCIHVGNQYVLMKCASLTAPGSIVHVLEGSIFVTLHCNASQEQVFHMCFVIECK